MTTASPTPTALARGPLLEGPFDLAIIGGGINGAGIARDAALRGKTVILLEKGDIASGTSSRSSKMVHGGIRYLEQLRFGLVRESLRERGILLGIAPHLVRPQAFVLPFYEGARRGPRAIRLGLFLYDVLSLGRRLGKSRVLSAPEVLDRVPGLLPDGLLGGGVYHDGVMDDARLALVNALAALEAPGAGSGDVVVRNHAEVVSMRPGSPTALLVRDLALAGEATVLAHRVVRAVGPWTEAERLVPSKGIHIVLPAFPARDGLLLTHARDGRVFFVIPWLGRTVVGTTETPFRGSPDALRAEPDEVKYLLDEVRRLFPGIGVRPGDVLATYAGVRPLARGRALLGGRSPGGVSRKHRIVEEGEGILTLFGGKYTTYRAVAKEVLDRLFPGSGCSTHRVPLPGGEAGQWEEYRKGAGAEIARHGEAEVERLFRRYGARLAEVLGLAAADPGLAERVSPAHPEIRAEVVHAARRELAVYPEDFLARRTSIRFTEDGGRSAYDAVEALLVRALGFTPGGLDRARERYLAQIEWEDRLRSGE
jgi:glycerol-3-phosphate dehydrogenase